MDNEGLLIKAPTEIVTCIFPLFLDALSIHWIYPPTQDASHHYAYYTFLVGNPRINLYLPLESWVGGRSNLYISILDAYLYHGSPVDQTKWLVFTMIHIKDSVLPRGKVWSLVPGNYTMYGYLLSTLYGIYLTLLVV